MRCYIFSAAEIKNYDFINGYDLKNGFVICADGGYKHVEKLGLIPDVWLGDGDSLEKTEISSKEKIVFPARKDKTDTELAVDVALSRGYRDIVIFGGLGGRIDHEYANFCVLKKICDAGANAVLVDEKNEIFIQKQGFDVYPSDKKYISFFPFAGDVEGFSVDGLRYGASNIKLECSKAQASSNCFDDEKKATVSFESGYLLVIRSND